MIMELKLIKCSTAEEINNREVAKKIFELEKERCEISCFMIASKKQDFKNTIYWGIRYINRHYGDIDNNLPYVILQLIERITYREFMQIFPLDKEYDGHKYGWKDYFTTVEYLKDKDLDDKIGENAFEFIMNYNNARILNFLVEVQIYIDREYEKQTGINPFNEFIKEHNLTTYTMHEAGGQRFLMDNKGKTFPVKEKTSLKVIK